MAEDWIKMRTDLYRDPKVCMMADLLMESDGELARYVNQHCQRDMTITRNVMRNVTVGALVSVWGVMRMRGKPVNTDLVCHSVTLYVLDDIADLPGFGNAMESVGWVVEDSGGLTFPRFFEDYNVDPEASAKEKAAERQRRFRERQKAVNGESSGEDSNAISNVTVTSRSNTEKRREEKRREEETTHTPSVPAQISIVLRKYSIAANPSHPSVIALAEQGVDLETLEACCKEAREAKPNENLSIGYVVKKLEGWKAQARSISVQGVAKAKKVDTWFLSVDGMNAKARELGISGARMGESEAAFKSRIQQAINAREAA